MYIHVYTCIQRHTHIHVNTHTYTHKCVYTYMCIHTHTHIQRTSVETRDLKKKINSNGTFTDINSGIKKITSNQNNIYNKK